MSVPGLYPSQVCSIYIHDGVSDVIAGCTDPDENQFGISLFSTLLGKHSTLRAIHLPNIAAICIAIGA
jgi:hypothetical protein